MVYLMGIVLALALGWAIIAPILCLAFYLLKGIVFWGGLFFCCLWDCIPKKARPILILSILVIIAAVVYFNFVN